MSACEIKAWIRRGLFFWAFYCLASTCGCTSESGEQPETVTMEYPKTFTAAGFNWRREQNLGASDSQLLTRYFKSNPSLADSPAFQGLPAVYHGTRNRRRFYWIQGSRESRNWVCLQYSQGRFQFLEGTGLPWRDHST